MVMTLDERIRDSSGRSESPNAEPTPSAMTIFAPLASGADAAAEALGKRG
jgi:hypothetical protein